MADGYDWLLANCGQPGMVEHAAHLDDDEVVADCFYCQEPGGSDRG